MGTLIAPSRVAGREFEPGEPRGTVGRELITHPVHALFLIFLVYAIVCGNVEVDLCIFLNPIMFILTKGYVKSVKISEMVVMTLLN